MSTPYDAPISTPYFLALPEMAGMYRRLLSFLLITCMTLASCSQGFVISVYGTAKRGVYFEFYEDLESNAVPLHVATLNVDLVDEQGNQLRLWSLSGLAVTSRIKYGEPPSGLTEVSAAIPLLPGNVYKVFVADRPPRRAPGVGETLIVITANGAAAACPTVPDCWKQTK